MQNSSNGPVGSVPEHANEHCPGTEAETAGKAAACEGCPNQQICATAPKGPDPDVVAIGERLRGVRHKLLVLSGKGGVGKSTVAAQLAFALALWGQHANDDGEEGREGRQVGLLDVDICGPSIPRMLGLEGEEIHQSNLGWSPVFVNDNLGVMSIGFLLPDPDEAVVWRGPRKNGLIKQFLKDVDWGELDYLVVDAPPGTSDEHISLAQYLKATPVDGAIIVTTPQEVSVMDVRKEINFCRKVGIKVLGVIENMSGLEQRLTSLRFRRSVPAPPPPHATDTTTTDIDVTDEVLAVLRGAGVPWMEEVMACTEVFHVSRGGGEAMAKDMGVPFLGRIPLDPALSQAAEEGRSCFSHDNSSSPSSLALQRIITQLVHSLEGN